jgi:hypothetical protein
MSWVSESIVERRWMSGRSEDVNAWDKEKWERWSILRASVEWQECHGLENVRNQLEPDYRDSLHQTNSNQHRGRNYSDVMKQVL